MGLPTSHEAHRHGSHLRLFSNSPDLRGSPDSDALVLVEGQADDAKLFHVSLASRLRSGRSDPGPLASPARLSDSFRFSSVQHPNMAAATNQVLDERIGLKSAEPLASQLSKAGDFTHCDAKYLPA